MKTLKVNPDYRRELETGLREEIYRRLISAANAPVQFVDADSNVWSKLVLDVKEVGADKYSEIALLAGDLASIAVRQFGSMCELQVAQQEADRKKGLNATFFG